MPILPPSCDVVAGRAQEMGDQRGRGRLAVGAGDGDERRARRVRRALAAEQLDVADHLDAGCARQPHRPVRRRMRQRHAGRQHQRGDPRPVDVPQIGVAKARAPSASRDPLGVVVAGDRPRRRRPRAPGSSPGPSRRARRRRRVLPAKVVTGIMPHRSLSVESPTSASTTEMIQKRITICGSVQPSCSK